MNHPFPSTAKRIAIIKPSALGDVVQSLPLLAALRGRYPAAVIDWVIRRDLAGLLQGHPEIDDLIAFDRRGGARGFLTMLRELRRRRFDLVIDLQGLFRTGVMTRATGAPVRLGVETAREGASWACTATIAGTGRDVPAHARCRKLIRDLGAADPNDGSGLWISLTARDWANEQLRPLPRPILAIHAGAGWETKRWPAEKFAAIASRFAGSIVAVGSPGEAPLASRIAGAAPGRALNLAGRTSLQQLAALLEAADLMLSNDSGPLHLAAAAGTPVVGVFTCTSPVISGPAPAPPGAAPHQLVATRVDCAASYCKRCPHRSPDHLKCLDELSVDRVWQAVESTTDRILALRRSA